MQNMRSNFSFFLTSARGKTLFSRFSETCFHNPNRRCSKSNPSALVQKNAKYEEQFFIFSY
ncbi:hypothetical protein EUZ95_08185 [Enterococcus durans]|nr:hypothetical protein EUZ95_08185 [Enterococcus durans]